jgi:diacylglycerol kinase family enzyme
MAIPRVGVVLNPRSGSGIHQPRVRRVAQELWVDVREVPAGAGPADLARAAVDDGAQILAAAGGDGTVSAVAGVAVTRDVPLVVVPCGTRNHFAKDCGADVLDPAGDLAAIEDCYEVRVDVGTVNGRVFLDNASVGFYAAMVRDPAYRDRRVRVAARYVRRAVSRAGRCASLSTSVPARVTAPDQVLVALVSNNAYSLGVAPGGALRPRLDEGRLWVYLVGLPGPDRPFPRRLVGGTGRLLIGRAWIAAWPTTHQTITTRTGSVPIGVDGEAVELDAPLDFDVLPGALRVLRRTPPDPVERQFSLRW